LHSEQSAYALYLIRKNHLADNLNGAWFLLWFYLLSFILMLFFDFVHFILGILDKEFYVIRSSYIRTVLASGPISFVLYLVKRTR
jgi:hypothetical protein